MNKELKMNLKTTKSTLLILSMICLVVLTSSCRDTNKKTENVNAKATVYPSDVVPFMDQWRILCGDGTKFEELTNIEHKDYFYVTNDGNTDWVIYKTPNSGTTSRTSSNTRTELGQKEHWTTEIGGKLTGSLKVMHVSTSGDARVAASYSVVVGQIHGNEGHENEPLKIFYKKFPGHTKGSVFWNYEINTAGDDNSGRWDYSTPVWGYDMSVVGSSPTTSPEEPKDGIALGEEFSYEINVYNGIMYLTFKSEGHETKTFTKNLLKSDFAKKEDIPQQIWTLYAAIGRDGVEREQAYAGELQNFKQGAYNQTNGKNPEDNIVWSTGSETYNGDIEKQYANGCYAEVWFKNGTLGAGTDPNKE
ncbi:polysaccharide lyase family 7 protein [Algibacter lectus]|uniref:polysaccharide lyase family 7 protein n=1 Tax=Algibacter lectus TaxID=221126 RepID=UPI0026EB8AB0|nr:polysaccharide lyase family 7 protein [Algibacter lectus]MDO7136145.1 polysaccharide lyase family 7 protein [Algibacter lectus]